MAIHNLRWYINYPENIIYNGNDVDRVIYNGVVVFDKSDTPAPQPDPEDIEEVIYTYGNTKLYSNRPYAIYIHTHYTGYGYTDWYRFMNHNSQPVTEPYKENFYVEKGITGFYIYKKVDGNRYYINCQEVTSDLDSDLYQYGHIRYTLEKPNFEFYYGDNYELLCTTPSGLQSGYKIMFRNGIDTYRLKALTTKSGETNIVSFFTNI